MRNPTSLDRVDRAILRELRANAKISNQELARRVHLTPAPCLRRVKRLEAEGVIAGYHARTDPTVEGRGFEVTVSVEFRFNDQQTVDEFEAAIVALDEVVDARRVFGNPDYILRVLVEDANAYERFQTNHLLRLPGINRTISHQTLKLVKQEY
jgi:DNA-binding Lrp family transcriptional regulator